MPETLPSAVQHRKMNNTVSFLCVFFKVIIIFVRVFRSVMVSTVKNEQIIPKT